jgi:hypothetical protein
MKWRVQWMPRALKDAREPSLDVRGRVSAAIERLAEQGVGDVLHRST